MQTFVKRFLPFFAAFALGLLVTSFFVTAAFPGFHFRRGFRHSRNCRLRFENQKLRERVRNLEIELNQQQFQQDLDEMNDEVQPRFK